MKSEENKKWEKPVVIVPMEPQELTGHASIPCEVAGCKLMCC